MGMFEETEWPDELREWHDTPDIDPDAAQTDEGNEDEEETPQDQLELKLAEMEARHAAEMAELETRFTDETGTLSVEKMVLHKRQSAERRALEFRMMDIDLADVSHEYGTLLDNLGNPDRAQKIIEAGRLYRKLTRGQKETFKQRVLAAGIVPNREALEKLIKDFWD